MGREVHEELIPKQSKRAGSRRFFLFPEPDSPAIRYDTRVPGENGRSLPGSRKTSAPFRSPPPAGRASAGDTSQRSRISGLFRDYPETGKIPVLSPDTERWLIINQFQNPGKCRFYGIIQVPDRLKITIGT